MGKNNNVEIQLLNQKIFLKTSSQDPDLVQEVVDLVSSLLRAAEKRSKGATAPHQVALLALLDLAESYVKAQKSTSAFKGEIERKTTRLLELIEAELR